MTCTRFAALIAAALTVTALQVGISSASPVPSLTSTVDLAGITKVSGEGVAVAGVRLPRPVRVFTSPFMNRSISVRSTAPFAGVALRQVDGRAEMIAMRVSTCVEGPCKFPPLQFMTGSFRGDKDMAKLPAGYYELYVFSDGAPVTATLRLSGLEGSTRIVADDPANGSVGELDPYLNDNSVRPLYSAAVEHSIENMGISLVGIVMETEGVKEGEIDSCLEERRTPSDVPRPHPALCLTGSGMIMGYSDTSKGPGYALAMNYSLINDGDYTHSLNFRGVTEVKAMRGFEFSLGYRSGHRRAFTSGSVMGTGGGN